MRDFIEQVMWYVDRYMIPAVLWMGSVYLTAYFIAWKINA